MVRKHHKYITRNDSGYSRCWIVRFCYKSNKITHQKSFTDTLFGSKHKSLKAALAYRLEFAKKLGIEKHLTEDIARHMPRTKQAHNSSGIIGVSFRDDLKYGWQASYSVDQVVKNRYFGIATYGEKGAFKHACQLRFEYSGTLQVYRGHKFPGRIPVPWEYIN